MRVTCYSNLYQPDIAVENLESGQLQHSAIDQLLSNGNIYKDAILTVILQIGYRPNIAAVPMMIKAPDLVAKKLSHLDDACKQY